jgi:hypothetical protein
MYKLSEIPAHYAFALNGTIYIVLRHDGRQTHCEQIATVKGGKLLREPRQIGRLDSLEGTTLVEYPLSIR